MRLIPDCIRDILLDIEECTAPGVFYNFKPTAVNPEVRCSKYDPDTVLYHIKQCELNGYLTEVHWYMDRLFPVDKNIHTFYNSFIERLFVN